MFLLFRLVAFVIFCIVVILFAFGLYRHNATQNSDTQKIFLQGTIPGKMPEGFFKGYAEEFKGTWEGKVFDRKEGKGINIFRDIANDYEKYPFIFYVDSAFVDRGLQVIKIDYDVADNPFWQRFIAEEIVQVDEDEYLGKLHIRFPGGSFAMGFFTLKKAEKRLAL